MVLSHVITHSLFYAAVLNGYLFLMMIALSPRVWGYSDYPEVIKAKVSPQTTQEKRLAMIVALPWFVFILGFPFISTYMLKFELGGEIPFWTAFLNIFGMVLLGTLGDLVILDWLIINKITPEFVMIPGTDKEDYQDFSHHYKAHAIAAVPLVLLCLFFAAVVWYF